MTRAVDTTRRASSPEARALLDLARTAVKNLVVLIRNSQLYDPSNKVFDEPIKRIRSTVQAAIELERRFDLEIDGFEVFVNGIRVRADLRNLHLSKFFVEELTRRGLGGVGFPAAPDAQAIGVFLRLLGGAPDDSKDPTSEFNRRLTEAGATGILALPPRRHEEKPPTDRRQRAIETYQQALDFLRYCMTNLESPADVNVREAKRVVYKLVDLSYEGGGGFSMLGLTAIKGHDQYTFNHMVNVCILAIAFGQRLGLARDKLSRLGLSALYHDLGKLKIPLDILGKHGPLTDEEWAVMGNHTVFGARELFPMIATDRDAVLRVLVALQHHIGYDGSGYPKTRMRTDPILYARIVAIVDAFDAMTTRRVYQRKFLPDEALAQIQKVSGAKYDPLLVKAFVACIGIYPVGSTVLLSNGEVGVVCEPNQDPAGVHRPKIRLATDTRGNPIPDDVIDLAAPEHASNSIVRCIDPESFGINAAHFAV
ncbi:MAG: HD-GYP domain-containing protein [Thermoanaerobaculales bacterium]